MNSLTMTCSPGIFFYTLLLFYYLAFNYRIDRSVHLKQMLTLRDSFFFFFFFSILLKEREYSRPLCFWLLINFKQSSGPTVCLSIVPHTEIDHAQRGVLYGLDCYLGPKDGQQRSHEMMLAVN